MRGIGNRVFTTSKGITLALAFTLLFNGCGGTDANNEAAASAASAGQEAARTATFTDAELEKFERGLRAEIDAVKAAQERAGSATSAEERGKAMQAQWETATMPAGATASGLSAARYGDIRSAVDRVFTTLDFQNKIDGPLSIDLQRADAATKARVSGDAFAELPADAAKALRSRMDRLVPLWSEYKTLVAVAG
jgi:hypothetical protein